MLRILFLLFIVMCPAAFGQTDEPPKAVKVDEFGRATNGHVKMKMDYFYVELNNNPAAQGYIINYGTNREIAIREKQIRVSIAWRKYDAARITFVSGGFREEVKTELWYVPPGAANPEPNSTAKKIDEFRKIPDGELKARLDNLYVSIQNNPNSKGYIVYYGSAGLIAAQVNRIKTLIAIRKYDSSLIIFKNAGFDKGIKTEFWLVSADDKNKSKTQLWIVPSGAKPPTQ